MVEISIQEDIFKDYPTFRRGIVVARNTHNKGRSETLAAMLEETIADAGLGLSTRRDKLASALEKAGLVHSRRDRIDGRWIYYSVDRQAVDRLQRAAQRVVRSNAAPASSRPAG